MNKVKLNKKIKGWKNQTLNLYQTETETEQNTLRNFLIFALSNFRSQDWNSIKLAGSLGEKLALFIIYLNKKFLYIDD